LPEPIADAASALAIAVTTGVASLSVEEVHRVADPQAVDVWFGRDLGKEIARRRAR
jgi:hypothetical protein